MWQPLSMCTVARAGARWLFAAQAREAVHTAGGPLTQGCMCHKFWLRRVVVHPRDLPSAPVGVSYPFTCIGWMVLSAKGHCLKLSSGGNVQTSQRAGRFEGW